LSAPRGSGIDGPMAAPIAVPPVEGHAALVPFAPAATRSLEVHGAPVSLVHVPDRRNRANRADDERPAMARSRAARIVANEAIWRSDGLALTPNRYPFASGQRLLWMARPAREPDGALWRAALGWVERSGGSALLNNIGAAATIPRAHVHLVDERLPFLDALPERPLRSDLIDAPDGCELLCKDVPFCVVGVRGEVDAIADALLLLADARLTATWNVVLTRGVAWIVPRRVEVPAPHFPQALGAAEVWGRWCYVDEAPYAAATGQDLEEALRLATMPALA